MPKHPKPSSRELRPLPATPRASNQAGAGAFLLSIPQAAQRLGLSQETLRHWRWKARAGLSLHPAARELCDAMVTVGRAVRIPETAVEQWLRRRRGEVRHPEGQDVGADELGFFLSESVRLLRRAGRELSARVVEVILDDLDARD